MAPAKKTLAQYESEAVLENECLVHPSQGAARKVYQLRHGSLTTAEYVCHKCDNPKCIKNEHHFLGSCKDNVQDAVRKGRHSGFRKGGVRNTSKHTEEAKKLISEASKRLWGSRSEKDKKELAEKISATQKGVPKPKPSEATKAKMRAAHARRLNRG